MRFLRVTVAMFMGVLAVMEAGFVRIEVDRALGISASLEARLVGLTAILMLMGAGWLVARGRRAAELIVWASAVMIVLTLYLLITLDPALHDRESDVRRTGNLMLLMICGFFVLVVGLLELRARKRTRLNSRPPARPSDAASWLGRAPYSQ